MLNITDVTKSAYLNVANVIAFTISIPNRSITFTNDDIVIGSAELTEAIENNRYLTFMGCIASMFKFKIANIVTDLRGEYVEVTVRGNVRLSTQDCMLLLPTK